MATRITGIGELLTLVPPNGARGGEGAEATLGLVRDAALLLGDDGRVAFAGPRRELPSDPVAEEVDLGGAVVLPGLVDAHTHLVFAGDRTRDFADRCSGVPYEEVARRGGGIRLTVRETRLASNDRLADLARPRLRDLLAHGVTTVEVKSGYGLSVADELRMLEVVQRLDDEGPQRLVPTVLGAHVVPDEHAADREGWVRALVEELLPEVARRGLARFVDAFCDRGAFTLDETVRVLERGRELGLGLKVHAEQLSRTGGSAAAARLGAVSADHLEHASQEDLEAMAEAGTAAVLLPAAGIFLGTAERPPARRMLDLGLPVALATDCNPGTCPTTHLPLVVTFGCAWLGLSPAESLRAVTRDAARAIGLDDGTGTLAPGSPADLVVADVPTWTHVPWRLGANPVREVRIAGRVVHRRPADSPAPWT